MDCNQMVTGIVVTHNTKELIERAFSSVRKFHPSMKIIIVDGSDPTNECYSYVETLKNEYTRVFHAKGNIGHGKGLCVGISYLSTPYFLIFDSDIEMLKSPVQEMLNMMEDDTLGVGYTEKTAFDGHEWGSKPIHKTQGWMRYLHPYFCLLQLKEYIKYKPFCHHGAPAVNMCLDTYNRGVNDKAIKEFPGLGHSSGKGWVWEGKPREYIRHDTYGTRAVRVKNKKCEIEGKWDPVISVISENPQDKVVSDQHGGVTCITCTGDRPEAFNLCVNWMKKQVVPPSQWIIVDDGKVKITIPNLPYVKYVRRDPKSTDSRFTMILNMKEALRFVTGEKIIMWEDDEYYSPLYIKTMSEHLDKYEVVGIGRNRYYHLLLGTHYTHANMGHASLAQTSFRKTFLPDLYKILDGDSFLDIRIWNLAFPGQTNFPKQGIKEDVSKNGRGYIFEDEEFIYVGMKGMPGRKGIGSGHRGMGEHDSLDNKVLHNWIKEESDFQLYLSLKNKYHTTVKKLNVKQQPILNTRNIIKANRISFTRSKRGKAILKSNIKIS